MESARNSLTTLQGLLDEGFITQQEFKQRRAKIIDAATSVKPAASNSGASVFSRLGSADEQTGRTSLDGAWGHDGYESLYGGGGKAATSSRNVASSDLRSKLNKNSGGDLRSKLSKGRGQQSIVKVVKPTPGGIHKPSLPQKLIAKGKTLPGKLPAKCPW